MKLLESGRLEALSSMLSSLEVGDWRIMGRVESYSCKVAGGEQKSLYKKMKGGQKGGGMDKVALSPPTTNDFSYLSKSTDSEGEYFLTNDAELYTISRKTLFNLITTLNQSFYPDYDFSDAKSHEFCRIPSMTQVWADVDSRLGLTPAYNKGLKFRLWEEIDIEIGGLKNAEIYSYKSDLTSDPFSEEGCCWHFNYFFYNVKLKRIVFFTCRAISPNSSASEDSEINMDEDD